MGDAETGYPNLILENIREGWILTEIENNEEDADWRQII